MRPVLFLTILLFIQAGMPLAHSRTLGYRNESDALSSNIPEAFARWERCYGDENAEGCAPCDQNRGPASEQISEMNHVVGTRCLPSAEDQLILFSQFLNAEQTATRDGRICKCFESNDGTPSEMTSYRNGTTSSERMSEIRRKAEETLRIEFGEQLQSRLRTERTLGIFSAMSYVDNSRDALRLSTKYSQVKVNSAAVSGARVGAAAAIGAVGRATSSNGTWDILQDITTQVNNPEAVDRFTAEASREVVSEDTFNTGRMPEGICVPYRFFVSSKQFPTSAAFYESLQEYGNENDDWNYSSLMHRLRDAQKDGIDLARNRDPRIRYAYARVEFLHHNPVFKNIFMSRNGNVKRELSRRLRQMPSCNSPSCRQSPSWIRSMNQFRRSMAGFLAQDDVIRAAEEGAPISGQFAYLISGRNAQIQSRGSDRILNASRLNDPAEWTSYCRFQERAERRDVALDFLASIESDFGERNIDNIAADREFQSMNSVVCNSQHRNRQGRSVSFNTYLTETCGPSARDPLCAPEKRGELIARFFNEYSSPVEPGSQEVIASILPFIKGDVGGPTSISTSDARDFNTRTRDPDLNREPVVFQSREYSNLTPAANRIEANRSASVANSNSATTPGSSQFQSVTAGAAPSSDVGFVPVNTANTAAPGQRAENSPRAQIDQNEADIRQFSQEITSLRNVIDRGPTNDVSSSDIQLLETKFNRLKALVDQKERENVALRRQIEEERNRPRSEVAAAPVSVPPPSRRQSGQSRESQVQVPQGGVSAGVASSTLTGGTASLSGNSAGYSGAGPISSRSPSLVPNLALLSKYGVQSVSEQGALIVSASSSEIDYTSLEAQTANSILPLEVTPQEFDLLASNDQSALNRYLDQVRAVPGDVVRINLTGGENQSMELYVVKAGGQISIVQGPGLGRASRAPASAGERQYRLTDLLNELGQ